MLVHERNDMVETSASSLGLAVTARMGAKLRFPLREAADHFRRCARQAPKTVEWIGQDMPGP